MTDDHLPPDPFDDELRRRLRSSTSRRDSADADLAALRPRFRRSRRRRSATISGAVVAAAVVVGVSLSLGGSDQAVRVSVAGGRPTTEPTVTTITSTVPSTTVASAPLSTPTTEPDQGAVEATTTPPPAGGGGPASQPTPTTTAATVVPVATTTTAKPGGLQVLTSDGGTATVTWTAVSLTVDRTDPAPGWTLERTEQKDATRVVVRFRRDGGGSGSSTATIDARVVDGRFEVN